MGKFLHAFFSPLGFRHAVPQVWDGFQTNIKLMVIAEILVLIFALGLAIVRGLPGRTTLPLRVLAVAYTDFFRGTPLILVAYVWGLGIPSIHAGIISNQSLFTYGIISLTLVYTAYVTEVYRAGIESVHPSQRMAARSLGLSYTQALRHVVLPQAIRRVVPPLLNDFIGLQKDTALLSVIGLVEAARTAQDFGTTEATLTGYMVAAFLFVLVTIPLARFLDRVIARQQRRQRAGGVR